MITNKLSLASDYVELEGTSKDDKPTENVGVNSKFTELDTGDAYYFDGAAWQKYGAQAQT